MLFSTGLFLMAAFLPAAWAQTVTCPEEIHDCPRFVSQIQDIGRYGLEKAAKKGLGFQTTLLVDVTAANHARGDVELSVLPAEVFKVEKSPESRRSFRVTLKDPGRFLALLDGVGEYYGRRLSDQEKIAALIRMEVSYQKAGSSGP